MSAGIAGALVSISGSSSFIVNRPGLPLGNLSDSSRFDLFVRDYGTVGEVGLEL